MGKTLNMKGMFGGAIKSAVDIITERQIKNVGLWELFVNQFAIKSDGIDFGWRGEYWGKTMMGACGVVELTADEDGYRVLKNSVEEMLSIQEKVGNLSTYSENCFDGWDIWCRKYVLMGMESFYGICKDEDLKARIVNAMRKHIDEIIKQVGKGDGKIGINDACNEKELIAGVNSSSILEGIVDFYNITKEEKYLDFAKYILSEGGSTKCNLIDLALSSSDLICYYPIQKAYEMCSFFEGVMKVYEVTGEEKYKRAVINFADKILEEEFTVIGSAGCSHEYFDNSRRTQFNAKPRMMQETCVTISLLRLFNKVYNATGDEKYINAIETSFYNAYLGAVNSYSVKSNNGLPFDSYSPLIVCKRGIATGGYKEMENGTYYGCCAAYGAAGIKAFTDAMFCKNGGLTLNFYPNGEFSGVLNGTPLKFDILGDYPYGENIVIKFNSDLSEKLRLRIPYWLKNAVITFNSENSYNVLESYFEFEGAIKSGDVIKITGKSDIVKHFDFGIEYYTKGPIVLARDARLGDVVKPVANKRKGFKKSEKATFPVNLEYTFGDAIMIDYSSAGKTWEDDSKLSIKTN